MDERLKLLCASAASAILGAALLIGQNACTTSAAEQCNIGSGGDADCERILGVATGQAFCDLGTCRQKGTPPPSEIDGGGGSDTGHPVIETCTSTTACTAANGGMPSICRKPGEEACLKLTNDICDVNPLKSNDGTQFWQSAKNPIFVGVLFNKTILSEGGGIQSYQSANEKAAQLAEAEWFSQTLGGINVGNERRPIIGIYCDIKLDPDTTRRAFDHVTKDLGAQAVITETPPDVVNFLDEADARGTFLYLSEFGSDEITLTGKLQGRVFTTFPPINYSFPLMKEHVKRLEAQVRTEQGMAATDKVKLVVLGSRNVDKSTSAYLDQLGDLEINGAPAKTQSTGGANATYKEIDSIQTSSGLTDYFATSEAVATFAPHIVVTLEARDFHFYFLPLIESSWPSATTTPYRAKYATTESAAFPRRYKVSVGGNDSLRRRVGGVNFAFTDQLAPVLDGFLSAYQTTYGEENTDFVTSGYDAFYSTAYAIAAAATTPTVNVANIKGADIGDAMKKRLSSGTAVPLQGSLISSSVAILAQQGSINLRGTITELDWDPLTGGSNQDSAIYCVARENGDLSVPETGLYYRYLASGIEEVGAPSNFCP